MMFSTLSHYTVLVEIINKHAPERIRTMSIRPNTPWYDAHMQVAKQENDEANAHGDARIWKFLSKSLKKNINVTPIF